MKILVTKFLFVCIFMCAVGSVCANEVQNIDIQELKQLMQQGVEVIDVRTTSEWQKTGVVKGSHLIMFYDEKGKYDLNSWLAEVASVVNTDEPLILICHSGSRSKQLAYYLVKEAGYEKVYNVKKGIHRWIKEKNSIEPLK